MKTLKQIQYLFVAVLAMAMAACADNSPEEVFVPVELEGQGVYFAKATKLNYEVEGTEGSIDFKVYRTETSGPATVNVYSTTETTLFTIPETISFESGAAETTLTVSYANIVRGLKYDFNVGFEEGTDYGNSELNFTLLYPAEVIEEWEIISENAIYTDNLYSMYGLGNLTGEDIPSLKNIVVEKEKNSEKYRFKSPYNAEYWNGLSKYGFPAFTLPADFELPYIVIDGEYFKEKFPDNKASEGAYVVHSVALGAVMEDGVGPYFDAEETNFGSMAGNLSLSGVPIGPDNASYPAGKYDKKTKTFDFGACYHWLAGYGFYPIGAGKFILSLDPALLETNYERDYTWKPVEEATGYFTSELMEDSWMNEVEVSVEDPTFFKLKDIYNAGYHLYFFYDAETGKVKVPELQKSGFENMGNIVYMDGKGSATEDGVFTFTLNFFHYDKETEARFDLETVEESFLWGKTKLDLLEKGLTIEDYEGSYKTEVYDYSTDEYAGTTTLQISKLTDSRLIVKGLGLTANYDDSTILIYNQETGLLTFPPQQLSALYNDAYPVFATLYDTVTYENTTGETVVGGFMSDGTLQFISTDENSFDWNAMLYLVAIDKTYLFSGYYTMNVWTPATPASSTFNSERKNYVELKESIKVEPICSKWQKSAAPGKQALKKQIDAAPSNLHR